MASFEGHPLVLLAEIYIEALLVDEELADQVWEAWDKGEIDDQVAVIAWWCIFIEVANSKVINDFNYNTSANRWRQ